MVDVLLDIGHHDFVLHLLRQGEPLVVLQTGIPERAYVIVDYALLLELLERLSTGRVWLLRAGRGSRVST